MSIGNGSTVLNSASVAKTAKNKRKKENAKIKKAEATKRQENGDENRKHEEFKKLEVLTTEILEQSTRSSLSSKFLTHRKHSAQTVLLGPLLLTLMA